MNNTFFYFLFRKTTSRWLLISALTILIVEFLVFEYFYPFPDFSSDSYNYIYAATANLDISLRPIGYSKFLQALHVITTSDTALVSFQYAIVQTAALWYYFSILYFYKPGKAIRIFLFVFLFINPLFLYAANYVDNRSVFIALSLAWLTHLIWILNRPKSPQVFLHALLLFLCFTVSEIAWYYPVVAILAFILSRQSIRIKLVGIALPAAMILAFIIHTRQIAKEMTGAAQFSLSAGWRLANNALYMYGHIQVDSNQSPSAQIHEINRLSRQFYDKAPHDINSYLAASGGDFFIREPRSPLNQYFDQQAGIATEYDRMVAWGRYSAIYETYGTWLIRKYPLSFIRYFLLPNTISYILPDPGKSGVYNRGEGEVSPPVQDWFNYKLPNVEATFNTLQGNLLSIFAYVFFFSDILFCGCVAWFLTKRRQITVNRSLSSVILLAVSFLILNFLSSICFSVGGLWEQAVPLTISIVSSMLIIDYFEKYPIYKQQNSVNHETNIVIGFANE